MQNIGSPLPENVSGGLKTVNDNIVLGGAFGGSLNNEELTLNTDREGIDDYTQSNI